MPKKKQSENPEGHENLEAAPREEENAPIVTGDNIQPLPVDPPRPRRNRRSRAELEAEREQAARAALAGKLDVARGEASAIVGVVDRVCALYLPPPLHEREQAMLTESLAQYLVTLEDIHLGPGWTLVLTATVMFVPRVAEALRKRERKGALHVLHHSNSGSAGNGENDAGTAPDTGVPCEPDSGP